MNGISVVIPAYNEAEGIEKTLRQVLEHLSNLSISYEIIVVDDGSTDSTAEVVQTIPRIHLFKQSKNRGYGSALKTGIRLARYDAILIIDADDTYPAEMIPILTQEFFDGQYDMVVGARVGKNVNIPLMRRPAKRVLRAFACYLVGMQIPDLNSGLRVFQKDLVKRWFPILPQGFSFTMTITLAILLNDYRIKFIPINYHHRKGRSKIRPGRDTLSFFLTIVRTTIYFTPLKVFLPISLALFLISFGLALYSTLVLDKFMDVTVIVTFLSALQIAVTSLLADLVRRSRGE